MIKKMRCKKGGRLSMKKKLFIVTSLFVFAIAVFYLTIASTVLATSEDEVIIKGVYIDTIDIGGMSASEAKRAVQDYIDNLKSRTITVQVQDHSESVTLEELGYDSKDNNYIDEALKLGKSGNLIKRYKEIKDTEQNSQVYKLEFQMNDDKLKEFVKNKCSQYDVPAVDASVSRKNGAFIYTDESIGSKVDVEKTIAEIKKALFENWNQKDANVKAVVVEDDPKYTREMVEKCKTLLGTFSTSFTSSTQDRAGNVANGARLINNTVLYPGDVFSAYDKLSPFTTDNGYYTAGAYSNGKVIDSIGGGACQVTTTLYNAVLFSELEIVERSSHSMTISYADLSRDAAIAGTWKDLKFKNNTDAPILIEGYTVGRTITFKVWGYETRDTASRKVKFETVVLEEKKPGDDVITKDPTKPVTFREVTQSAHIGYVAELYKVVYENGEEVSRTKVNRSIYNASPRFITIGTKKEKKKTPEKQTVDENSDQSTTVTPTVTPSVTPTAENTENTEESNTVED